MEPKDKIELRDIFLLRLLNHEELKELSKSWRERVFQAGTKIFSEGMLGKSIYIITSGTVKITRMADGKEKELAAFLKGDFFGEIALFEHVSRTASATALTDVHLLEITREEFDGLLSESPGIVSKVLYQMIIEMSKRLRVANYSTDRPQPVTWI